MKRAKSVPEKFEHDITVRFKRVRPGKEHMKYIEISDDESLLICYYSKNRHKAEAGVFKMLNENARKENLILTFNNKDDK